MADLTSKGFSIDKADAVHILKVAGYSIAATLAASAALLLAHAQVPEQYLFLVPLANTIIVGIEKWATDHTKE